MNEDDILNYPTSNVRLAVDWAVERVKMKEAFIRFYGPITEHDPEIWLSRFGLWAVAWEQAVESRQN